MRKENLFSSNAKSIVFKYFIFLCQILLAYQSYLGDICIASYPMVISNSDIDSYDHKTVFGVILTYKMITFSIALQNATNVQVTIRSDTL